MTRTVPEWTHAFGGPAVNAVIRQAAEDFQVDEILGFEPDGTGDHAIVQIRKRNTNTEYVARSLAKLAGVRQPDIGYAGLKDRQAVTTQWFTVNLAGRPEPDWSRLETGEVQVLATSRHRRKLRRGCHAGNRFRIMLRHIQGDRSRLAGQLETIRRHGVPNYFGPQRFGRHNLDDAHDWLAGRRRASRHQRSLYLSVARSLLFNTVLSQRVALDNWSRALAGDVLMLNGSHSRFRVDEQELDETIHDRVNKGDLHPTGPLYGVGDPVTAGEAAELEQRVLEPCRDWCEYLEKFAMKRDRRALRVNVGHLSWDNDMGDDCRLQFDLPAGSYATAVLRECLAGQPGLL